MSSTNQEITFDYDLIKSMQKPIPTWEIRFTFKLGEVIMYEDCETEEFEFEETVKVKEYINNKLLKDINKFILNNDSNKKLYSVELWYVLYDITEYEVQTLWLKN